MHNPLLKNYYWLFLFYVTINFSVSGQEQLVSIKGKLTDAQSRTPLAYATVYIGGTPYGTSTDEDGNFDIELPDVKTTSFQLICSSVGYSTFDTLLTNVAPNKVLMISMDPMSIMLDAVSIYPDMERIALVNEMVEKAMKSLRKTCPPFQAKGNLTHFKLADGKTVKYREGEIVFNDPKGFGKADSYRKVSDIIAYSNKRESLDLSIDLIDYKNHILSTYYDPNAFLLLNGLKYKFRAKDYTYTIEDTLSANGVKTYVVNAYDGEPMLRWGKHFDEKYDLRFHLRENSRDKYDYDIVKYELIYWSKETHEHMEQTENTVFSIELAREGRFLEPVKIEHLLIQEANWKQQPDLRERQMISSHIIDFNSVDFEAKNLKTVPSENWVYDSEFWNDKPLERQVREDLSAVVPVEDQFSVQHDTQERMILQDQVDLALFNRLYNSLSGKKTIYLVFWDKENVAFRDQVFWPGSGYISNEKVETIFIGRLPSSADWTSAVDAMMYSHFFNFNMPFSWQRIVPDLKCSREIPSFVLIKGDGEVICRQTPVSKEFWTQH